MSSRSSRFSLGHRPLSPPETPRRGRRAGARRPPASGGGRSARRPRTAPRSAAASTRGRGPGRTLPAPPPASVRRPSRAAHGPARRPPRPGRPGRHHRRWPVAPRGRGAHEVPGQVDQLAADDRGGQVEDARVSATGVEPRAFRRRTEAVWNTSSVSAHRLIAGYRRSIRRASDSNRPCGAGTSRREPPGRRTGLGPERGQAGLDRLVHPLPPGCGREGRALIKPHPCGVVDEQIPGRPQPGNRSRAREPDRQSSADSHAAKKPRPFLAPLRGGADACTDGPNYTLRPS